MEPLLPSTQATASGAHLDLCKASILSQIHSGNRNELKAGAFQVLPPFFIKIVAVCPAGLFPELISYRVVLSFFFSLQI